MRTLSAVLAAGLAALLLQACAHERPAASRFIFLDSLAADSIGAATLDELFLERHAAVESLLAARGGAERPDPAVVEARALVAAAEEMYLYGRTLAALRILDEASTILRRNE
jgi:hypothetical protein